MAVSISCLPQVLFLIIPYLSSDFLHAFLIFSMILGIANAILLVQGFQEAKPATGSFGVDTSLRKQFLGGISTLPVLRVIHDLPLHPFASSSIHLSISSSIPPSSLHPSILPLSTHPSIHSAIL